ncbi:Ig-like domain-containing protein, partial [Halomonas sp. DP4Y7-2]|uniref:Ig-like domain-containing protein n=2 Tax=unclassified Halomonas TaxID=2609666 RepID=UPI001C99C7DB
MGMTVKVSRLGEELSEAVAWEVEGELVLETSSKVLLDISPEDIASLVRDGDDLIVEMANGQALKIVGFYTDAGAGQSELYLVDDEGGVVWADLAPAADNGVVAAQYVPQPDMAGFEMVAAAEEGGSGWTGAAILGGAAAAGLAAAAAGGGGGGGGSDDDSDAPASEDGSDSDDDSGDDGNSDSDDGSGDDQDNDDSTDDTAPSAPQIGAIRDDQGDATGPLASGDSTDDTTPTLSGSAEAGSTITIRDGDAVLGTVIADDSGNWSFTPSEPLAEGSHSLTVTATDAAGNTSEASDAVELTVDTTAPDAPVINPTDGSVISGTAEPGSTIELDVDGDGASDLTTTADETTGDWSVAPDTPLADDTVVTVTATDAAGNTSPETSLIVDAAAPATPVIAEVMDDEGGVTGALTSGDSTDDTTPTLSGTAEAGSTVTIFDGDTELGSVEANGSGNWTFTPTAPLAEGSHSLTVTATDAAGNTSEASDAVELTVDTTAPDAPVINPTDGSVISGTAEPGSTIELDVDGDGASDLTTTADETTGDWSVAPDTPLADDTVVTVTATDAAGNTSPETSLTVDAAAPATPIIAEVMDDEGGVTGALTSGDSTDDTTPTLSGTAEAGSTVTIFDGDTELGSVEANGSGNWTFTPTAPLAEGSHSLTVTATDAAGNTSEASDAVELTVDTTAPDAPVINPTDGSVISGTAEPGSTIELDVDGDGASDLTTTADETTGDWSVAPDTPLADDTVVTVTATDPAGNTGPQATTTVDTSLVDTQPPVAPTISEVADDEGSITGTLTSGDSTDDSTPTLSGSAEAGSTVTIFDGGIELGSVEASARGNWNFTPTAPLAEGIHSLTVTATDAADNTSEPSAAFELSVDTTSPGGDAGTDAPTLAIAEASDDTVNAAELSDGVQASVGLTAGTQAGDTITLQIDNADDVTYTVTTDDVDAGSATVVIPSDALTDG